MSDGKFDHFTEDQLRRIETKWKSDMEVRISNLQDSVDRIETAFHRAQGALVLVKWGGALCAGAAAVAAWASQHLTWKG